MAVYRCKHPFVVHVDGKRRAFPGGCLIQDSDPVFKGREHLFELAEEYVDRVATARVDRVMAPVEAAAAEPGELRAAPKRRGRKPKAESTEAEPQVVAEIEDES